MSHPEILSYGPPPESSEPSGTRSEKLKKIFEAEKEFLKTLGEKLFPDAPNPETRQDRLLGHLQDVCSTEIAKVVELRYGLNPESQGLCLSEPKIGRRSRIGVQTLWLLHHPLFSLKSEEFVAVFSQRYILKESDFQTELQKNAFKVSQALVGVYQDRKLLKSLGEKRLLDFLASYYGPKTALLFARYYRLGPYRLSTNYGLTGNIPKLSNKEESSQFKDHVESAVNQGRVVSKYLLQGEHSWTDGRGRKKSTDLSRDAESLSEKLARHEKQREILEELETSPLSAWQKELLRLTAQKVLSNQLKTAGVEEFNRKYNASIYLQDVRELEKAVLSGEIPIRRRPHWLTKQEDLKSLLNSPEIQKQLSLKLETLLWLYHTKARSLKSLLEDYPVSYSALSHMKAFIESLCWGKTFKKGELTKEEIEFAFKDDQLPPGLLEILKEYVKGQKTARTIVQARGLPQSRATGLRGIIRLF